MPFSFLNPWLWLGALALAAPIWLHLRGPEGVKAIIENMMHPQVGMARFSQVFKHPDQ